MGQRCGQMRQQRLHRFKRAGNVAASQTCVVWGSLPLSKRPFSDFVLCVRSRCTSFLCRLPCLKQGVRLCGQLLEVSYLRSSRCCRETVCFCCGGTLAVESCEGGALLAVAQALPDRAAN